MKNSHYSLTKPPLSEYCNNEVFVFGGTTMKESYFLGSSGKNGFFSCFGQLTPKIEGQYTYIIKGGPGTGKSSLMKKLADEIESNDIDCERILCSSDPDSLDGVIFPSLRVSICDGTSPHTLDPDYPGATGEIINLGECWNKNILFQNKEKIIELTDKNKACHKRSRKFIESAFSIFDDGRKICLDCLNEEQLLRYAGRISARFLKKPSGRVGLEKTRLLEAVTPKGYIFLDETVNALCDKVVVFEDDFGAAAQILIEEIRTYALASGFSVISSPEIGNERKLRHIIIKELSLAFITKDKLCENRVAASKTVSLRRFYDTDSLRAHKARLSFCKKAALELMEEAVIALRDAKEIHDELENCYIPAMDYGKIQKIRESLFERIWQSEWWPEE